MQAWCTETSRRAMCWSDPGALSRCTGSLHHLPEPVLPSATTAICLSQCCHLPQPPLQVCDFGLSASFLNIPTEGMHTYVVMRCEQSVLHSAVIAVASRWYRAPELLCGNPKYGAAIDVWSAGCNTSLSSPCTEAVLLQVSAG